MEKTGYPFHGCQACLGCAVTGQGAIGPSYFTGSWISVKYSSPWEQPEFGTGCLPREVVDSLTGNTPASALQGPG